MNRLTNLLSSLGILPMVVGALSLTGAVAAGSLWLGCSSGSSGGFTPMDGGGHEGGDAYVPPSDAGLPEVSCNTYCTTVLSACSGTNAQYGGTTQQSQMDDCMHLCAAMTPGSYGDTKDTVGCRQYFADSVAMRGGSPTAMCPSAGPFGGGICGDRCDDFCKYALALCTTANGNPQPWPTPAACVSDCMLYPWDPDAGEFDPNDTNHWNCFEYHLQAAYLEPDASPDDSGQTTAQEHCSDLITDPDAAPGGQPTCLL